MSFFQSSGKAKAVLFVYLLVVNPWQISAMRHSAMGNHSQSQELEDAVLSQLDWKMCHWKWSTKFRRYYFQVNGENGNDHMAIRFDRDPKHPKLRLYDNQEWQVAYLPDAQDLEWKVANESAGRDFPLDDVSSIYFNPKKALALEIMLEDDSYQAFMGGLYFPQDLMKSALRAKAIKEQDHIDRVGADVELAPNARALKDAGLTAGKATGAGAVAGLSAGVAVGATFNVAVGVLASSTLGVSIAGIAGSTAIGAAVGAAGGLVVGVGVGAAVGLATGIVKVVLRQQYYRREVSVSMSVKLFEKLRCHPLYTNCGKDKEGAELLALKKKGCPRKVNGEWAVRGHFELHRTWQPVELHGDIQPVKFHGDI